ncbi:MAG: nucleotidyltransferase [Lachnospiraceae bacterium]|nr:nucleotidyltransferase [Lachnospiraceae bacterium]
MKVNAIVAEYNPFHNGHKFHIEEAARKTDADYTVVIMSGNFVQRGAPALMDKYSRAQMALHSGADLCLELPACYAVSSAEYFATGAVALADKLGVVTNLCFGSECGDISILEHIADILLEEPAAFSEHMQAQLRRGVSYPIARTNALLQYDPSLMDNRNVLGMPNNILGIEYVKALRKRNSNIIPTTTKRIGSDYHDKRLGDHQCSARAIRYALCAGQQLEQLHNLVPEKVFSLMSFGYEDNSLMYSHDLSAALQYKLVQERTRGFTQYLDVSQELSDRIVKHLYDFTDYESFCDLLKSKNMTYTRISRCLLHILLDIKKEQMAAYQEMDYIPYIKMLGFRKDSAALLNAIAENAAVPLISKLADAKTLLPPDANAMLEEEIRMSDIYQSALSQKNGQPMVNEYRTPLVIV